MVGFGSRIKEIDRPAELILFSYSFRRGDVTSYKVPFVFISHTPPESLLMTSLPLLSKFFRFAVSHCQCAQEQADLVAFRCIRVAVVIIMMLPVILCIDNLPLIAMILD